MYPIPTKIRMNSPIVTASGGETVKKNKAWSAGAVKNMNITSMTAKIPAILVFVATMKPDLQVESIIPQLWRTLQTPESLVRAYESRLPKESTEILIWNQNQTKMPIYLLHSWNENEQDSYPVHHLHFQAGLLLIESYFFITLPPNYFSFIIIWALRIINLIL